MQRKSLFDAAAVCHNIGSAQPVINRAGQLYLHSQHISISNSNSSNVKRVGVDMTAVELMDREQLRLADIVPADPQVGSGSAHSLQLSLLSQLIQEGHMCAQGAHISKCGLLLDPSVQQSVQKSTGSALLYMGKVLSKTTPRWAPSEPAVLALLIQLLLEKGKALLHSEPTQQPQGNGLSSQQQHQIPTLQQEEQ
jgi:hypothetical protein